MARNSSATKSRSILPREAMIAEELSRAEVDPKGATLLATSMALVAVSEAEAEPASTAVKKDT